MERRTVPLESKKSGGGSRSMIAGPSAKSCAVSSRVLLIVCGIAALTLGFTAAAQQSPQSEKLQQQVQELKQEYEATTQALALRIATLEQQLDKEKQAAADNK